MIGRDPTTGDPAALAALTFEPSAVANGIRV